MRIPPNAFGKCSACATTPAKDDKNKTLTVVKAIRNTWRTVRNPKAYTRNKTHRRARPFYTRT